MTKNLDNSEIKTVYYNSNDNNSREHLLLPTDAVVIKEEEIIEDEEEYEGNGDFDESQMEGIGISKTQYVCAGCRKGFCYIGWLDRHKLSSPACRNAETIHESCSNDNESNVTTNYLSMSGGITIERQSNKTLEASKTDKTRPSLEGRLNELLGCPNKNCNFTTHWVQSLNKHVSSSCKFGGRDTGHDNSSSSAVSSSNKTLITCYSCNKPFKDIDEHMKTYHQMEHIYECKECALSFTSKYQFDAHISDHKQRMAKLVHKTNISSASKSVANNNNMNDKYNLMHEFEEVSDENDVIDGAQQQVWKCKCGKNYLSSRSYEIHCTSCEKALQTQYKLSPRKSPMLEQQEQKTSGSGSSGAKSSSIKSFRHFKREQIEAIHTIDFKCKYCTKELSSSYGLCNHLSRRPVCREWYYVNLPLELKKNNSSHLMEIDGRLAKRARYEMNSFDSSGEHSSSVNRPNIDESSTGSSLNRPRRASLIANSGFKSQSSDNSHQTPSMIRNPGIKHSISCKKCHKEFYGKNPKVALTNHLRGSTCNPSKTNLIHRQQSFQSRQFSSPVSFISNNSNANRSHGETRYYCKLCPRIEPKNRVSLGCHLTIYHGLPQVNVTTDEGDAYRCQTCDQVFVSKYFYNLHRHDCDLTSTYVGIISEDEHLSNVRKSNSQKIFQRHRTISNNSKTNAQNVFKPKLMRSESQDSQNSKTLKCTLCGRSGFGNLNAVKIHQKYQCVKRYENENNIKRLSNQSKLKPISFANSMRRQKHVGPGGKVYMSELAKLNDMAKSDSKLTMCDSCGRGPYNSYYYFLEHKRKFCIALKGRTGIENVSPLASIASKPINIRNVRNKAKKTVIASHEDMSPINDSFCLSPAIPRARKTMNFANASSPQVSLDSNPPQMDYTDFDNNEDAIDNASEIIKCSICFDDFDDILKFIRHRLSHITSDIMQNEAAEPLKCELCGAQVVHYQRIQQHLILHLQNVQIMKKRSLIEVTKKPHDWRHSHEESDDEEEETDDPVLHCPYCKSEYKSRIELADHMKKTCPFRYQCPNCNNTYSAKESYLEHKDECSKNTAISKRAPKTPSFKCRNCGLEFRIKQTLLWHEHACNKVYTADHSGRVEVSLKYLYSM